MKNNQYTICTLGSHSALQILKGAHDEGFKTLVIALNKQISFYKRYPFIDEIVGVNSFSEFPEIEEKIVQLLYNRGLADQRKIDEFFSPDYDQDLHDPFLMVDMEKGAERILEAIKKKEKIVIFGDYDADGVCASSILAPTIYILLLELLEKFIINVKFPVNGLNHEFSSISVPFP